MSLCDRDIQVTSYQNEYDFSKQLILVNMLKKRLYLRRFLTSFVNFYITTAFESFANYSSNFWLTASRFFLLLNRLFVNVIKNYKFDNFKTHKNLFFEWSRVLFYLITALHKKRPHLSVFSLNVGECGPE